MDAKRCRLGGDCVLGALPWLLHSSGARAAVPLPAALATASARELVLGAFVLLLMVLVPLWLRAMWFPWRQREGEARPDRRRGRADQRLIEAVLWLVPAILAIAISALAWLYTYRPESGQPIAEHARPQHAQHGAPASAPQFGDPDQVGDFDTLAMRAPPAGARAAHGAPPLGRRA